MAGTGSPSGTVVKSLVVGDLREPSAVSRATLRLYSGGELELYCADSGYAVSMIIGEDVREWRRWIVVAAADVARLGAGPGQLFDTVRARVLVESENAYDNESSKIAARLAEWLRSLDVPFTSRSEDWEG